MGCLFCVSAYYPDFTVCMLVVYYPWLFSRCTCAVIMPYMYTFSRRVTSKLVNDNTEAFYRMSKLYYELGEEEDSLRLDQLRECRML